MAREKQQAAGTSGGEDELADRGTGTRWATRTSGGDEESTNSGDEKELAPSERTTAEEVLGTGGTKEELAERKKAGKPRRT